MKFKTAHKDVMLTSKSGKKDKYKAHRDRNSVWLTSGRSTVFSHIFDTVREAGQWMNNPKMH